MKYAELHLHSMDRFDSQNNPNEVCERMVELGAKGFALTQHGTLAGVEPMRKAAEKYNLKFVPGVETYYGNEGDIMKNQHLILLSADATGYKAISMAVTDAQNSEGYSVMNDKILKEYFGEDGIGHGHVIATTACIQGPVAAILRQNEVVDRTKERLEKRYGHNTDMTERINKAQAELSELERQVSEKKAARDAAKKLSETKFAARVKALEKKKEKNPELYEAEKAQLDADMKKAEEAKAQFQTLKNEAATLLKRQTAMNRELKELQELQEKFDSYKRLMDEAEGKRLSDEDIWYKAQREIAKLVDIFGVDNFFLEVQYHGIPTEAYVYPMIAKLSKETGIPMVATNDVHIVKKTEDERLRRQILRSMRFGENWEEEGEGDAELYIKTDEEMEEWLLKILEPEQVREAMNNIKVIFDRCNVEFVNGKHYPKFPSEDGKTADEMLEAEIARGIKWRFPNGMDEEHKVRLEKEIKIIESMGYADYFLVVKDFLEYGRALAPYPENEIANAPFNNEQARAVARMNGWDTGIATGPGRGSGVGSLVCYLIGITGLDPLKYNLLFERRDALLKLR